MAAQTDRRNRVFLLLFATAIVGLALYFYARYFEFTLPRSQAVSLTVFDVTGRSVATLVAATLGPGPHRAAWNGRTGSGEVSPAGVYLCELRTEEGRVGRRFVVLP